jgi:hypothetical protein
MGGESMFLEESRDFFRFLEAFFNLRVSRNNDRVKGR